MDQTEPRFSKSLQDAGEHGVCIKKRTDKRQISYVGAGSLAVKKQRSEEWAKKKESASAQKSKEHAQKKGLVCDTADLLLLSQHINCAMEGIIITAAEDVSVEGNRSRGSAIPVKIP